MSIEMDAGVAPRAAFTAADIELETAGPERDPAEGWLMIFATLTGVLAASTLGVFIFLS
jgi:hypothetical protein